MNRQKQLTLEIHVLNKLKGRVGLLLNDQEKKSLVNAALDEVLQDESLGHFKDELSYDFHRTHFVENFFSYGIIEELLCDPAVEDIIINSLKPIYIHHAQKGFIPTLHHFTSRQELDVFIQKLIIFSGRSGYNKIANIELSNLSGRVNIIDTPLGPQLTISKAKVDPLSIIDLIASGSLTYELAAQLWLYMEGMSIRPANIIIAGGPGTGKTTLLNALMGFIPTKDRIVVIEDTLELNTFLDDSCSRLETDENLSLSDLVKNSLRMRPERIIVGEVRGEEARDMMTAVNIGKYCMCTIHALTAREAIIRLSNEPMKVPDMLINLVDAFVILKRYHVDGKLFRVVDEVSETGGFENAKVLLSQIFKYNYDQKKVVPTSPSTIYRDRLAQEAGISPKDIIVETWLRANVLKNLHERNVRTMKEVSTFCRFYSQNPTEAMQRIGLDRQKMIADVKK